MSKASEVLAQKKLKAFLERRHPEYADTITHWKFLESCYEGGRGWFKDNIFRYIKEGDKAFQDRLNRAYRFNHSREVVDLVDKHLFKQEVTRSADAEERIQAFWNSATRNKLSIRDFMRQVSKKTSTLGRIWICVDNVVSENPISIADEKKNGLGIYVYSINPKDVMDMSYHENGQLNWILIHEQTRNDESPIESTGEIQSRYRLWTTTDWTLYHVVMDAKGNKTIVADAPVSHDLGVVPVFAADHIISDELYVSPAMIDDVAYLDRAVANYLSNMDAIIQDQTFSQLAMPSSGINPGEEGYSKLMEMGTKQLFTYNGADGAKPFFLSPDVKQAELIMTVINKIIGEIYHTVGLAGERTKDDNSQGVDNSSGVAKAYDFERVNSLLAAKADSLEVIENRIVSLVGLYLGQNIEISERLVKYPDSFDTRGLYDEFEIGAQLTLLDAPKMVRREQMVMLLDKLFPEMKKELKEKMITELASWPPDAPLDPQGNPIVKAGKNKLSNKLVS